MTTKDETARQTIVTLTGYTHYIGMTTTELTDGATTNPVVINGKDITAKIGDIVIYGSKDFILTSQFPKEPNSLVWQEFGDLSDSEIPKTEHKPKHISPHAHNCINCGAPLRKDQHKCEYCGTEYF